MNSYFTSYMAQPKSQLDTFRAWAGKSSDISYYLNSHFIDFHCWSLRGRSRPVQVVCELYPSSPSLFGGFGRWIHPQIPVVRSDPFFHIA